MFKNRNQAGILLAAELEKYKDENPIIIALPRGGVVLGYEISKSLNAPLDVMVTRKIGSPMQPEFGIGAIAPGNIRILDKESINILNITEAELEKIIHRETLEMERRLNCYRKGMPPLAIEGKTAIVVDDGLATGVTAKAAIMAIKQMSPHKIILAVPVSPKHTANYFRKIVDELICLNEPEYFYAVGAFYSDFAQVEDEEVIKLLEISRKKSD